MSLHVGLAELKAALGGGWATLGDIIMYKKSLFWSLQGGAVSSSASRDVLGPAGTSGPAWPLWRCPLQASARAGACSSSMAWFPSWITLSPPAGRRGKSSPSARWCHLIPFLGEAGICSRPCEQDPRRAAQAGSLLPSGTAISPLETGAEHSQKHLPSCQHPSPLRATPAWRPQPLLGGFGLVIPLPSLPAALPAPCLSPEPDREGCGS